MGAAVGSEVGDFASEGPSGFIKNAGQNAIGAAEAGASSYALGAGENAIGSAFPETSASISGAIPDLGINSTINSAEQSLGFGGSAPLSGGGNTISTDTSSGATNTNPVGQPTGAPPTTQTAGNLGGGAAGGASAPAGVIADPSSIGPSDLGQGGYVDNTGELSQVGTAASSPSLQSASNAANGQITPGTQNLLNNLQTNATNSVPVNDALNPAVINADNAASPGGNGTLNQQSTLAQIAGSTNPVDQSSSLTSAGNAAGGAGGAGGAGVKAPNSIGALFQDGGFTGSNVLSALGNNIGPLAAAGGIGLDALKGSQKTAAQNDLTQEANAAQAQGQQLENYLQTGTLPAGEQAGVNQALDSAVASIKSHYASMGMSGSSAEQQDIANAQQQAQAASAQMQEQLLSTGISETGMSSQLYDNLLKNSMANDTNLSNAIASFASAASGGGQNINLSSLLQKTGSGGSATF